MKALGLEHRHALRTAVTRRLPPSLCPYAAQLQRLHRDSKASPLVWPTWKGNDRQGSSLLGINPSIASHSIKCQVNKISPSIAERKATVLAAVECLALVAFCYSRRAFL